jgi:hypothetical protein
MKMNSLITRANVILFFSCVIILSSCVRDEEKTKEDEKNNYIFSGIVTDQVTGQIVSGAAVSLVSQLFCEVDYPLLKFGNETISDADGKFRISISGTTFDNRRLSYGCIYTDASKSGYSGSLKVWAPSQGLDSMEIKLLHFGQLNLHVTNDTVNNDIDSVEIWVSRWPFYNYPHEYTRICRGRKFDEIFLFDNLWGGIHYNIQIGPIGRTVTTLAQPFYESSIIINPDIPTEYTVAF